MTMTPTAFLKVLVLAGLALPPVAATAQDAPRPATPPAAAAATTGATRPWNEQEYRLGPGDKLRVEIYGESQLSQNLQVRPDGKITLPLAGDLLAAGRTSLELRDAVATALKDYFQTIPVVTVIVQDAISNQIDVVGEVASPGPQVLQGPVNILQALSRAGGLKEFAKKGDIRILRQTASGLQTIKANYTDALKGKEDPMILVPGDTVVVP